MYISKWLGIILASLLLVACGDDDDNDTASPATDSSQTTNTSGTTTITAQNSATVASLALKRLFGTLSAGGTVSNVSTGTSKDLAGGVVIEEGFNLLDYAKWLEQEVENSGISPALTLATGTVISDNNLPCDVSGTNDFAWDDQDDDQQMSGGDTITITAHNCVEDGETTNGQVSLTLIGEESMSFVFTDFITVDFEGTSTLNGDLTMTVQEREADSFESVSISSNSFRFSDPESAGTFDNFTMTITTEKIGAETLESVVMTADAVTMIESGSTEILRDFSIKSTDNLNTLISTLAITGILDDSVLGIISLDTLQPFEGPTNDDFPYSGILKITATDNSSVILTALDAVNVRLDVDENGDGTIDQTSDTTWTSLDI